MLIFIIWLIGWFVSYAVSSRLAMSGFITTRENWDNFDRKFCVALSLLSWVMVMICLAILFCLKISKISLFGKYIVPFLKKLERK